jgi:tetratricopeptide (TPR) repeat protein
MQNIFFELFLIFYNWQPLSEVNNNNNLKNEIIVSYYQKNLENTEKYLHKLLENTEDEPELNGNLGLVLYQQKKYMESKKIYNTLQNSSNVQVAVEAQFHLGLIDCKMGDTTMAIKHFENALKNDFRHESARYNLELLKKKLNVTRKISRPNDAKNKVDIAKNLQATKNILDPLSEKEELLARLTKINLTESQAKNIFDALGKGENKYIQQVKRKRESTNGAYNTW